MALGNTAAAEAVEPHCALRNSFHFISLRVPAACASLYLALHSLTVSACAGFQPAATVHATTVAVARPIAKRRVTEISSVVGQSGRGAGHAAAQVALGPAGKPHERQAEQQVDRPDQEAGAEIVI